MKLVLNNIHKTFQDTKVLQGSSYEFNSGEITALLGKNGAGKTTLFNILYGELPADEGEFYLVENSKKSPLTDDDIGMVFSENYLPEFLTGYEFIKFYIDLHPSNTTKTVDDYLDFMKINSKDRHRIIKGYSDGMKSKLSLLCVLIKQPKIILLDEPLTAVDVISSIAIKRLLLELQKDHIIILSTHIMALAEELCDSVAILNNGVLKPLKIENKYEQLEDNLLKALEGDNNDT